MGLDWGLKFNATKCHVITMTYYQPRFIYAYMMYDTPLTRSDHANDLGLTIESDMSWKTHIKNITGKANRQLWLIIRCLGFFAPIKAKRLAYISLVRSVLEYATTLWSPLAKELIKNIETIQRKATNLILNNPRHDEDNHLSYKQCLIELNLFPLTFRREMTDIIFFLKSINGQTGFNPLKYLNFQTSDTSPKTRNQIHDLRIIIPLNKYANTAQAYPPRLARTWISLPLELRKEVISLGDPEKMKRKLIPYYRNRLYTYFDTNNTCTWVHACNCNNCKLV